MNPRLVFLLGSGISLSAEIPSVSEISDRVMNRMPGQQAFTKYCDGIYLDSICRQPGSDVDSISMPLILDFLSRIEARCKSYFAREVNYEDIGYMAWQIYEKQVRNYENPALVPLLNQLRRALRRKHQIEDLTKLSMEANAYIHSVVRRMLSKPPARLGAMPALVGACQSDRFARIDVFTLNHDTLLEQELQRAGIEYSDGFAVDTETCSYWDLGAFNCDDRKVRLGKLHGSVDWYLYRPDPTNPWRQMVGRATNRDPFHTANFAGEGQYPIFNESMLLIGRHPQPDLSP